MLVVISTHCTGSCQSNYHTNTTAPSHISVATTESTIFIMKLKMPISQNCISTIYTSDKYLWRGILDLINLKTTLGGSKSAGFFIVYICNGNPIITRGMVKVPLAVFRLIKSKIPRHKYLSLVYIVLMQFCEMGIFNFIIVKSMVNEMSYPMILFWMSHYRNSWNPICLIISKCSNQ
jgi:hypothetical protein